MVKTSLRESEPRPKTTNVKTRPQSQSSEPKRNEKGPPTSAPPPPPLPQIQVLSNSPPPPTLVKYNNPKIKAVRNRRGIFISDESISFSTGLQVTKEYCEKIQTNVDCDGLFNEKELTNILQNLYPSIEWRENNKIYEKTISLERGTLTEILGLCSKIEEFVNDETHSLNLLSKDVQDFWIQAFDECIRQILVEKPLEGILLRRIRDFTIKDLEIRKKLYMSCAAFFARKDIQLTQQINKLKQELQENVQRKSKYREEILALRAEQNTVMEKFQEQLTQDHELFQAELIPLINEKRRYVHELKLRCNLIAK